MGLRLKSNATSTISIELKQNVSEIILRIQDNGIGFDLEKQKQEGVSLGLEIIETVSEQLGAKYSFEINNGTIFTLSLRRDDT